MGAIAPCPVSPAEFRGGGQRRRRIEERSADRTRVRQPLLPALVAHVEDRHQHAKQLLDQASAVAEGDTFTVVGRVYRRYLSPMDCKRTRHETRPVRAVGVATGEVIHISTLEDNAFWEWAIVETLRHSGVRIEELAELSHLSIRQYERPNGEIIVLLVIAPSKTDRERVIPMSTELFHIIAQIVRRHTQGGQPIAMVSRFDAHDKVWSIPLPFLFQRQRGTSRHVITPSTMALMLRRRCAALAEQHPGFRGLAFTPHDFRRIVSATELINSGLPIHIGAALLGHLNIQTTRAATSPSSTTTWSATTSSTFSIGATTDRPPSTATPVAPNGASSRSTSTNAESSWAPAPAPTARRVSTNTPASAARCSTSTRRCWTGSPSSKKTSMPGAHARRPKTGSARSKAST
ncbi:site-specific integrase [Plantactinospora sp. KLBMP9567]|uniref:site-specific integrase n=1 Tax=Plantactinospora sp. KLBMP9567 TaxID=3085900 RepID=UPI002982A69B|nr:site-specific integrase [Plantactinospora sp. KLBMP9567]MDW5328377.1 site-specific integrase [Plantactinospora sp. KLBMP9567]